MTVFAHSSGGFLAGKQVFPVDYEAEVSQRLVDACVAGDVKGALECVADPFVDVNFVGAVCLRARRAEVVLREEAPDEVVAESEELRTDATPLFLAAHAGNVTLVRKLLIVGADVNQKVFRGFASTAAAREGHTEILEILLKTGASQPACEEALLEACSHGRAKLAELLMASDMIRPNVAVHSLVTASCRGFTDVVATLIKCGVDANAVDRVLLRSSKPALHTNVDCTALVAAIVSKQVAVVRQLLQTGVRTDCKVRLGAWSWDSVTGEELRVGAGMAEAYGPAWCAVEYFESSGAILQLLMQHHPPTISGLYQGRTLLFYAILCSNLRAVDMLLALGADHEFVARSKSGHEFRPIHLAARLGHAAILKRLVSSKCDVNSFTDSGETALMFCARARQEECLRVLLSSGADLGVVNKAGQSAAAIAELNNWTSCFNRSVLDTVRSGKRITSSRHEVFSPLLLAACCGDVDALNVLIKQPETNLNEQDGDGFSAVMLAAAEGHVAAFRVLIFAGADVKLLNSAGDSAMSLAELHKNRDMFEKVMLEYALERGSRTGGFHALHCAARRGDYDAALQLLTSRDRDDVNMLDSEGYTPLMLAAREQQFELCKLLISHGADCEVVNQRGETALILARKNGGRGKDIESVILDKLARALVLRGERVQKHTKEGRGEPHPKELLMVASRGVLSWGKSERRNVVCREAVAGPSNAFRKNRRLKGDADGPGVFRIVTKNREVHFVCADLENAKLWVRGIKLITEEASAAGSKSRSELV
ncbi:Ankyrin-3 [Nymphaea thermarum]|nr:Ankyrin-3 [Nymphaea thermarum]